MNQKIAHNWAISPNLGQKIKSCPFWLKIDTYGILEVLIPNRELDFWNSDHKIHSSANLGPKNQCCSFCLKICAQSISRMLIPNPDLNFWNSYPKINFWASSSLKTKSCLFCLTFCLTWYSDSGLRFLKFRPQNSFLGKFGQISKLSALSENWCT